MLASITTRTPRIVTTAAPRMKERPIAKSPSMLITTVVPATMTERPEVSSGAMVAASGRPGDLGGGDGGAEVGSGGVLCTRASSPPLAEPGDHQQRVVDAD